MTLGGGTKLTQIIEVGDAVALAVAGRLLTALGPEHPIRGQCNPMPDALTPHNRLQRVLCRRQDVTLMDQAGSFQKARPKSEPNPNPNANPN